MTLRFTIEGHRYNQISGPQLVDLIQVAVDDLRKLEQVGLTEVLTYPVTGIARIETGDRSYTASWSVTDEKP